MNLLSEVGFKWPILLHFRPVILDLFPCAFRQSSSSIFLVFKQMYNFLSSEQHTRYPSLSHKYTAQSIITILQAGKYLERITKRKLTAPTENLLNKNISPQRQLKAHQHKVANYVYGENNIDHRASSPSY